MPRFSPLSRVLALLLATLFVVAPTTSAQTITGSLPGITVTGTGIASAPAETAVVVISIGSDPYMYTDAGSMGQPPTSPSAPIVTAEEIAAPVVDALVAAGLSSAEIEVISNPYLGGYGPYGGPLSVSIRFTLDAPTVESIQELLDPAIAAATSARLFINMTSVVYGVEDCISLHRQAREAAILDTRMVGGMQADALGVSLGEVVASRDNPYGVYGAPYYGVSPVNSCTQGVTDLEMVSLYGAPAFDPNLPAEVVVQTSIELTFEIAGEASSTPAP